MKNNIYFNEFERIAVEWKNETKVLDEKRRNIVNKFGWDSKEFKVWYAEYKARKFPFSSGETKAYYAWKYSESEEVEMNDFCWDYEVHDFINAFRKAGIETFVYTNTSSSVMENLHLFVKEGCEMLGLCTITKNNGYDEELLVTGIRFKVNVAQNDTQDIVETVNDEIIDETEKVAQD